MRDVYLWTGYGLGVVVAAALIKAVVRRWLDWQDRRAATAPTAFHTEVQEPFISERSLAYGLDAIGGAVDYLLASPPPQVDPHPTEPVWAVEAFMAARRLADERLEEFARPVPNAPALIWAELDGIFTARGLVTA